MALDRDRLMRQYAPRLVRQQGATPWGTIGPVDVDGIAGLSTIDQDGYDPNADPYADDEQGEPAEPEDTGVMVAFFLDPQSAAAIALGPDEGSVDVEEPEELHLTLAYLGKAGVDVLREQLPALIDAVTAWAVGQDPIAGVVSGVGRFNNIEGQVTYASVDAPSLPSARQDLVGKIAAAGLTVAADHGFTPHITLAYGDVPGASVPRRPVTFSTVTVAYAGQQTQINLRSSLQTARFHASPRDGEPLMYSLHGSGANASNVTISWNPPPAVAPWSPVVSTIGGRTIITAPATTERAAMWGEPPNPNPHMLWMQGRFVGAEVPNKNNALWSIADLQMGKPTVAHGPLNWLHQDRHVIGTIADSQFVPSRTAQTADAVPEGQPLPVPEAHITALAAIWRWLYPDEASVVEMASESGMLAYSMECISQQVECVRDEAKDYGCGQQFSYLDFSQGNTCAHLQDRASVRRLVNPTFLGGAVIVPPTKPGWGAANASVLRQAAAMAENTFEQAGRPDIPAVAWEQMMAGVLTFAQVGS